MGRRLLGPPPLGGSRRRARGRPGQPRAARVLTAAPPHAGLYRRATAAAFVVAPLLFLVDNLLHPKEYARDNEWRQLEEIADHYTRWQVAHLFAFFAVLGFAVAALGLAFLVRRRSPGLGLAGGALAMLGLLCLMSVLALDGFTWGVLGHVGTGVRDEGDAILLAAALHEVQQSGWSLQFYLPALAFAIGMVTLAVTAARTGALPAAVGWLLALGTLLVGTEGLVVSNAYYVAGSVVMLTAGIAVALSLWRMRDDEFAGGGS